jgi:hypothetical protein
LADVAARISAITRANSSITASRARYARRLCTDGPWARDCWDRTQSTR